jgi:hypothetical protein
VCVFVCMCMYVQDEQTQGRRTEQRTAAPHKNEKGVENTAEHTATVSTPQREPTAMLGKTWGASNGSSSSRNGESWSSKLIALASDCCAAVVARARVISPCEGVVGTSEWSGIGEGGTWRPARGLGMRSTSSSISSLSSYSLSLSRSCSRAMATARWVGVAVAPIDREEGAEDAVAAALGVMVDEDDDDLNDPNVEATSVGVEAEVIDGSRYGRSSSSGGENLHMEGKTPRAGVAGLARANERDRER